MDNYHTNKSLIKDNELTNEIKTIKQISKCKQKPTKIWRYKIGNVKRSMQPSMVMD